MENLEKFWRIKKNGNLPTSHLFLLQKFFQKNKLSKTGTGTIKTPKIPLGWIAKEIGEQQASLSSFSFEEAGKHKLGQWPKSWKILKNWFEKGDI